MDKKTTDIVKKWLAKFDAAVAKEDLAEMTRIVDACAASPNQPFQKELLQQLTN